MTPDELALYLAADLICHSAYFKDHFDCEAFEYIQEENPKGDVIHIYSKSLGVMYVTDLELIIPKGVYFRETYELIEDGTNQDTSGRLTSIQIVGSLPPK